MDISFIQRIVDSAILNIHTAFIGRVTNIQGSIARVQPLIYQKDHSGNNLEPAEITAYIPPNIKYTEKDLIYISDVSYSSGSGIRKDTEQVTVLVPDTLAVGDIVYCGICERDTENALKGIMSNATRHHDINDSIILKVL